MRSRSASDTGIQSPDDRLGLKVAIEKPHCGRNSKLEGLRGPEFAEKHWRIDKERRTKGSRANPTGCAGIRLALCK